MDPWKIYTACTNFNLKNKEKEVFFKLANAGGHPIFIIKVGKATTRKIETPAVEIHVWAVDKIMCYWQHKLATLVAILNMQMSQIYIFGSEASSMYI